MRPFVYLLGMLLAVVACDRQGKQARPQNDQIGREMVFPEGIVYTRFLKDTIDYQILDDADYKVVVYIDSIGCTECKLKLPEWKDFIAHVDTVSAKKVAFLFFYDLKETGRISFMLKQEDFQYPVSGNVSGQLRALNRFRAGLQNQTFLLDKDNRIVAIGSPLHDLEVKDLYLAHIVGDHERLQQMANKTFVRLDASSVDMGTIAKGVEKDAAFELKNAGKHAFAIFDLLTSCGCTHAESDRKVALPGETIMIRVKMKPKYSGSFLETVYVRGNTDEPILLEVKGEAR